MSSSIDISALTQSAASDAIATSTNSAAKLLQIDVSPTGAAPLTARPIQAWWRNILSTSAHSGAQSVGRDTRGHFTRALSTEAPRARAAPSKLRLTRRKVGAGGEPPSGADGAISASEGTAPVAGASASAKTGADAGTAAGGGAGSGFGGGGGAGGMGLIPADASASITDPVTAVAFSRSEAGDAARCFKFWGGEYYSLPTRRLPASTRKTLTLSQKGAPTLLPTLDGWIASTILNASSYKTETIAALIRGHALNSVVADSVAETRALDFVAQALWGVAEGTREDILRETVAPGGWKRPQSLIKPSTEKTTGVLIGPSAAARAISDTSSLEHHPDAIAFIDATLSAHSFLQPNVGPARPLPQWATGLNLRIRPPDGIGARVAAEADAQYSSTNVRLATSAMRVEQTSSRFPRSGRAGPRRAIDLSLCSGNAILLDHFEDEQILPPVVGTSARIVTFLRAGTTDEASAWTAAAAARARGGDAARGDGIVRVGGVGSGAGASGATPHAHHTPAEDEADDIDMVDADAEGGAEGGAVGASERAAARRAVAARQRLPSYVDIADGHIQVLAPDEPVPFFGDLDAGEALTTLTSPLAIAPLIRKDCGASQTGAVDFLLILCAATGARSARAVLRPVFGGSFDIRAYAVGQALPRYAALEPPTPHVRGAAAIPTTSLPFLSAAACTRLQTFFSLADASAEARAVKNGLLAPGPRGRLTPGIVSIRSARKDFGVSDLDDRSYVRLIENVAVVDWAHGALRRRPLRAGEAPTRSVALTPENYAAFDSMRAGILTLRAAGVANLRFDDRPLDEALRRLQALRDAVVERLQSRKTMRASATVRVSAAAPSSEPACELWQLDGTYSRIQCLLVVAQAVHYALALTPWTTTRNTLAFAASLPTVAPYFATADSTSVRSTGDLSAVCLADANGVGDMSGRGESFSLIREMTNRGLHAARSRALFAAVAAAAVQTPRLDVRTLSNSEMAQILLDYGYSVARIKALKFQERRREVRTAANAALLAAHSSGQAGVSSAHGYAGLSKLPAKERRALKEAQAKEILLRQCDALSERPWLRGSGITSLGTAGRGDPGADEIDAALAASDSDDGDESDGNDFASELEKMYGRRQGAARMSALRADKLDRRSRKSAVNDEVAAFEAFRAAVRSGTLLADDAPAAAAVDPLAALQARFRGIPPPLFQPPQTALVASTSAGTILSREGARNPEPLSILSEFTSPTLMGATEPAWGMTGPDSAKGKVLRTVRTIVDASGAQRVIVTYSVSKGAVLLAWLRSVHGLSLGSIGPPRKLEGTPAGAALVSGGQFRPFSDRPTRLKAEAARALFRSLYTPVLVPRGFVSRGKAPSHVTINGAAVATCPRCRVWGHRTGHCPMPLLHRKRGVAGATESLPVAAESDSDGEPVVEEEEVADAEPGKGATRRAANLAVAESEADAYIASEIKKDIDALAVNSAVADAAVDIKGGAGGATAEKVRGKRGRASVAKEAAARPPPETDASLPLYKDPRYENRFSALRDFARLVDTAIATKASLSAYSELWNMRRHLPPAVASSITMVDIETLRLRVITRRYATWAELYIDLSRLEETAAAAFGKMHQCVRLAAELVRDLREWATNESSALKRCERDAADCAARIVRPRLEALIEAVEVARRPVPQIQFSASAALSPPPVPLTLPPLPDEDAGDRFSRMAFDFADEKEGGAVQGDGLDGDDDSEEEVVAEGGGETDDEML